MGKGLYVLYGCLLISVYLLRQLDFKTNKSVQNYFESLYEENLQQINTTNHKRLLAQDPVRVKICDAASDDGVVTQDQKDKAQSARDMYRNSFGASLGDDLINSKTPDIAAQGQKIVIIGLLLIFFLITPLLTLCYCCYCCCDKKCPLCCKNDIKKNPFTRKQLLYGLVFVILLSALTFSTSIAGYVYSNQINSSYKSMKCTIVSALDDLNSQQDYTLPDNTKVTFLGLDGLKTELSNILSDFSNYFTSVNNFSGQSTTDSDKIQKTSATIENMLNSMKSINVPLTTYVQGAPFGWQDQISGASERSIFFDSTNYPNLISVMVQAQKTASDAAVQAMKTASDQAVSFAQKGESSVSDPIKEAQKQIDSGKSMIKDAVDSVDSNTSQVDTVFNLITVFLMVFYGIFMFIAVAGAALSFFGYLKNMYKVRLCLNAFWCILGLLTFIGFLICIVLGLLTILMMESCEAANKFINDKDYLQTVDLGSADLKSYLTTCKLELGGDGNILKKFNIDSQINSIKDTQKSLSDAFSSFDLTKFQEFEKYMRFFLKQHEAIEAYGVIFTRSDQNWSTTPPDQIGTYTMTLDYQTAAAAFKIQTDNLSFTQTTSNIYSDCIDANKNDRFVFEFNQCASYSYDAAHTPATPGEFTTPLAAKDCINYELRKGDFNLGNTNSRYPGTNCVPNIYNNFYARMNTYVNQANTKFSTVETFSYDDKEVNNPGAFQNAKRADFIVAIRQKQTSDSTLNPNGFGVQLNNFANKVKTTILDGSTKITDAVLGPNGILTKVNCLYFGITIENFYQQMCSNSAISIYDTFKIMSVLCFSNFTLIIFLYKMSMKFLGKKKEEEGKPNNATVLPGGGQEMQKFVD